jgi:hypothetical protein
MRSWTFIPRPLRGAVRDEGGWFLKQALRLCACWFRPRIYLFSAGFESTRIDNFSGHGLRGISRTASLRRGSPGLPTGPLFPGLRGHMHISLFRSRRRSKVPSAPGWDRSLIAWRRLCARGIGTEGRPRRVAAGGGAAPRSLTSNSPRASLRQAINDPIRTRPAFGWETGATRGLRRGIGWPTTIARRCWRLALRGARSASAPSAKN